MPLEVFGEGYHQFVSFDVEVLFKNVPSKKNRINITYIGAKVIKKQRTIKTLLKDLFN